MLCVEFDGNLEVVDTVTWEVERTFKLSSGKEIWDIAKLEATNHYALGLENGGVQRMEIKAIEGRFEFKEINSFLKSENVLCIHSLPNN